MAMNDLDVSELGLAFRVLLYRFYGYRTRKKKTTKCSINQNMIRKQYWHVYWPAMLRILNNSLDFLFLNYGQMKWNLWMDSKVNNQHIAWISFFWVKKLFL